MKRDSSPNIVISNGASSSIEGQNSSVRLVAKTKFRGGLEDLFTQNVVKFIDENQDNWD